MRRGKIKRLDNTFENRVAEFVIRRLHPHGNHLSQREVDEIFTSILRICVVVLIPVASFVGYVQPVPINPINTPKVFWFFLLYGVFIIGASSVLITYSWAWDPETDELVARRNGVRVFRRKFLLGRFFMRSLGIGFVCYALGGAISQIWNLYGLLAALVCGAAIIKAFTDVVRDTRKYHTFNTKEYDKVLLNFKIYPYGRKLLNVISYLLRFHEPNTSKLESTRLRYGKNNGYSLVNHFYGIAINYPEGWKVKFLDKTPLKAKFFKDEDDAPPAFDLQVYRTLVPKTAQELQEAANQFIIRNMNISHIRSYWTKIGTTYYGAHPDLEPVIPAFHDVLKSVVDAPKMPLHGIDAYVVEYMENSLRVTRVFFFRPNKFVAALIFSQTNVDCSPLQSIPSFIEVIGSVHFVPDDDEAKRLEPVYYYFPENNVYVCSKCGTSFSVYSELKNPCPICSSFRNKVWCQECSFLNPTELFIQNKQCCAKCGKKVDAKATRISEINIFLQIVFRLFLKK